MSSQKISLLQLLQSINSSWKRLDVLDDDFYFAFKYAHMLDENYSVWTERDKTWYNYTLLKYQELATYYNELGYCHDFVISNSSTPWDASESQTQVCSYEDNGQLDFEFSQNYPVVSFGAKNDEELYPRKRKYDSFSNSGVSSNKIPRLSIASRVSQFDTRPSNDSEWQNPRDSRFDNCENLYLYPSTQHTVASAEPLHGSVASKQKVNANTNLNQCRRHVSYIEKGAPLHRHQGVVSSPQPTISTSTYSGGSSVLLSNTTTTVTTTTITSTAHSTPIEPSIPISTTITTTGCINKMQFKEQSSNQRESSTNVSTESSPPGLPSNSLDSPTMLSPSPPLISSSVSGDDSTSEDSRSSKEGSHRTSSRKTNSKYRSNTTQIEVKHESDKDEHNEIESKEGSKDTCDRTEDGSMDGNEDEKPWQCPVPQCTASYQRKGDLKYHILRKHNLEAQSYPDLLRSRSSKQNKNFVCPITSCQSGYMRFSDLKSHFVQKHGDQLQAHPDLSPTNKLACPVQGCSAFFTRKGNLRRHVKQEHSMVAPDSLK